MIDFRYHLVSIIAVFLALTVGLVLGTTMLQDPLLNTLQSETADLRGQSEELRAERDDSELLNTGADQFTDAVAADVLEERLLDREVVLVAAPGADEEVVQALGGRVEEAGGSVAGRVLFEESFLDSGSSTFVDELALQVAADPGDLSGNPYDKAGTALGHALAVPDEEGLEESAETEDAEATEGRDRDNDDTEADGEADTGATDAPDTGHDASAVLSAFSEGGLLTVEGSPAASADALIVVAPASNAPEEDAERVNTALSSLTAALHRQVGPTVLAGGTDSGRPGGLVALARDQEPSHATVDVVGRSTGNVVAVLALADSLDGSGSAYGIGEGVVGFLPDPLPGPVETAETEADAEAEAVAESGNEDEARRRAPRSGE
ncbi:copper transporter [Nocardiopsis sp. L17-MgMaSL7]|uniref:copper transporter n=1 Tax=Nocardiopsis sp. L17-MgMaSL7 TaxID=1938893 RepID=UPI000D7100E9|nr:copper transporter [Nocardiopsis sp. L17-MgMaSL7]PWV46051.1 copper transport outer membrane protein MctB [Nocardiopsis sp. L17-MgMaSL7]